MNGLPDWVVRPGLPEPWTWTTIYETDKDSGIVSAQVSFNGDVARLYLSQNDADDDIVLTRNAVTGYSGIKGFAKFNEFSFKNIPFDAIRLWMEWKP